MTNQTNNDGLNEALAVEETDTPTPSWTKVSKRVVICVSLLGFVGVAALVRRAATATDADGDGIVSFHEMMSCNAGWFSSCTNSGDITSSNENNANFNANANGF